MRFWHAINAHPGFAIDALTADELQRVRGLITSQYLHHLSEVAPALTPAAAEAGIERYHTLAIPFDHGSYWSKDKRVLGTETLTAFEGMGFFHRIRATLPSAVIYPDDTMWRMVRPNQPADVGPVHADKWFWDAGNGAIPAGYERFKIWIAIHTEPGLNGLCVKSDSHTSTRWKHHFEFKHGKMKPVLDESQDALEMELLPLKSGDMVLFHDALLHGGVVNRGTTCRVSLELTIFHDAGEGRRALEHRRAA
jgi:hypothetical protein